MSGVCLRCHRKLFQVPYSKIIHENLKFGLSAFGKMCVTALTQNAHICWYEVKGVD